MKKFIDLNHANFSLKFPFENKLEHFFSISVKAAGPCMEFYLLPCTAQVGAEWPISRCDPFCEPLRYQHFPSNKQWQWYFLYIDKKCPCQQLYSCVRRAGQNKIKNVHGRGHSNPIQQSSFIPIPHCGHSGLSYLTMTHQCFDCKLLVDEVSLQNKSWLNPDSFSMKTLNENTLFVCLPCTSSSKECFHWVGVWIKPKTCLGGMVDQLVGGVAWNQNIDESSTNQ